MSKNLFEDFTTGEELEELYAYLRQEKENNGWQPRITIADWMRIGAGHAILIEPDGRAIASPVWDTTDCLVPFGNLHHQRVNDLGEEAADTLIMLMSVINRAGIDLEEAFRRKEERNESRVWR